jgi:murein DD-endopeptidase MepM/ murein hydrolase activator NlpD
MLTAERKTQVVALLRQLAVAPSAQDPARRLLPVPYAMSGGGHPNAIDLFTPEGTPVRSSTRGVVILSERDWSPDDLFSTSSRKGGNSVIVFDPGQDRFYRYCHMAAVQVAAGDVVEAGQTLGSVGHTGISASQPGHGRHLHFEVNEYADGRVHALSLKQLRALLKQWRTASMPLVKR